jgi:hypothetical protein
MVERRRLNTPSKGPRKPGKRKRQKKAVRYYDRFSRQAWEEEDLDRPDDETLNRWEQEEQHLNDQDDETLKNLIGIARICEALKQLDQFRNALRSAEDQFISAINQPEIPQHVRDEYWRFWRAGGCSFQQWREWLNGKLANKQRVPVRGGLRLVVKNKTRRHHQVGGGGPRVA